MVIRCQSGPLIRSVKATYRHIDIYLSDGTHISAPLDWYPHLPNEKRHDRAKWESMRWWIWQHLAHQRHLKCANPDKIEILFRQNPKRLTQKIKSRQLACNTKLRKTTQKKPWLLRYRVLATGQLGAVFFH